MTYRAKVKKTTTHRREVAGPRNKFYLLSVYTKKFGDLGALGAKIRTLATKASGVVSLC